MASETYSDMEKSMDLHPDIYDVCVSFTCFYGLFTYKTTNRIHIYIFFFLSTDNLRLFMIISDAFKRNTDNPKPDTTKWYFCQRAECICSTLMAS